MPPPSPWAAGQKVPPPHNTPEGDGVVDSGAARLPVMRLSSIVTVAPMPSADAGTSIPPPVTKKGSGFDVLRPPVIVTPLIVTVGSTVASASPIVKTGAP